MVDFKNLNIPCCFEIMEQVQNTLHLLLQILMLFEERGKNTKGLIVI